MLVRVLRRLGAACAFACLPGLLVAQAGGGRIAGKVVDAKSGVPLPGANVEVVGAGLRATTNLDGRYSIQNVPAGTATVTARLIGRQPKSVTGLAVPAGGLVELDIALAEQVVQLEEVVTTVAEERGSVNRALDEQRNATQIVNAISAEQIQKSPDGDAGQAVQRVAGVSVQDGKFVFVRGLGERYTVTQLNGARMASTEPERKVVPFDLFPAGMIEGITTSKTFTPDQPGDFSGAAVNIKTKEFPDKTTFTLSVGSGYNTAATRQSIVTAPLAGGEWIGSSLSERALPLPVARDAAGLGTLSPGEVSGLISSFRNVWSAQRANGNFNGSMGASLGGARLLGTGIGYLASFNYANAQEIRKDEQRALAVRDQQAGTARGINQYAGETGRTSVIYGGLLNLSGNVGSTSRVQLNNTYTRGADNEATVLDGFFEQLGDRVSLTRLTYVERIVRSNQLRGDHLLFGNHSVSWTATNTFTTRQEPDRSDLVYRTTLNGQPVTPQWLANGQQAATRTFSGVREMVWDFGLSDRVTFRTAHGEGAIKVGGAFRGTERLADARAFDINNLRLNQAQLRQPGEQIFGSIPTAGPGANPFTLFANNFGGRYDAKDRIGAGFLQFEVPLAARLMVVGGARVEKAQISVVSNTITGSVVPAFLENTDLLPSLALTFALTDAMNVRVSGSQTLARPELRELSPVPYFDILGGLTVQGNALLRRSLIRNADIRWEWFPSSGEVLSLSGFYKNFQDPIERALAADAGRGVVTFFNAPSANNYGVELEARKRLLSGGSGDLYGFSNVTLMQSSIDLSGALNLPPGIAQNLTNPTRPMVGQSPWVVNAGLTFAGSRGLSATVLYNVVGRRITEVGTGGVPDAYEERRHLLDVSLQAPLWGDLGVRADARNLLDAPYRLTQGDVLRARYLLGRVFSLGFSWRP
ncbi:MAG: TonB-dependent receptor [Gemmatimonadales bacterium]|nr:TonB-dependent receptor [Gemmatimonadales bacterium]